VNRVILIGRLAREVEDLSNQDHDFKSVDIDITEFEAMSDEDVPFKL